MIDDDDDFTMPFDDDDELLPHASATEVTAIPWNCAMCGETNETLLDLEGGFRQEYVEDCAVCCRPNVISIAVDPGSMEVRLVNELEG